MTDTLFETTPTTNKYETWEPDALKKKAVAADEHITTLERELASLRVDKQTDARMEELLQKLDNLSQPSYQSTTSNVGYNPAERTTPNTAEVINREDILNIVQNTLEQKQKETLAKQNVEKIRKELVNNWGENYQTILASKANELGVNQNFLSTMAESHPDAFLKLVLDKNKLSNPNAHVPPTSVVNTIVGTVSVGESYKDFKKAEKDNPRLRYDPAFQAKKHEAAERLGDSFYT